MWTVEEKKADESYSASSHAEILQRRTVTHVADKPHIHDGVFDFDRDQVFHERPRIASRPR